MFPLGVLTTLAGVFVLSQREMTRTMEAEQEEELLIYQQHQQQLSVQQGGQSHLPYNVGGSTFAHETSEVSSRTLTRPASLSVTTRPALKPVSHSHSTPNLSKFDDAEPRSIDDENEYMFGKHEEDNAALLPFVNSSSSSSQHENIDESSKSNYLSSSTMGLLI
jgi:hypothetical protein